VAGRAVSGKIGRRKLAVSEDPDQAVMKDAPFYPIVNPNQPLYHASYVHNAVYVPAIQQFDPTNVWLSPPG
jgi:peptide/nickel transport system substrate-binding protein